MNKIKFLIVLIFNIQSLVGQNLIPNGDFEEGPLYSSAGWEVSIDVNCTFTSQENGPDNWIVLDDSPDRLISGNIHCDWDNSEAQSGIAFINLIYMEAGKTTLGEPLKKDSIYQFSGYYKINTFNGISNQSNRFYIKFSNTNDSIISPYTNQTNWKYFDTIFKAKSDANEIEIWVNEFAQTGVYIDNIKLEKTSTNSILENKIDKIKIYPNPAQNYIHWNNSDIELNEIKITDIQGNEVMFLEELKNNIIDISNLQNGIYILFIKPKTGNNYYSKIIINK
jgi:hypothetical protein